jgi:hypothetical protein
MDVEIWMILWINLNGVINNKYRTYKRLKQDRIVTRKIMRAKERLVL